MSMPRMSSRAIACLLLSTVVCLGFQNPPATAAQPRYTTIHVDDMHCATCAKKIAGKLYAVAGVVEVRADVEGSIAYVVPQQEKDPSPRALWEAVEKAGFKPVKLQGPGGIFTAKPRS